MKLILLENLQTLIAQIKEGFVAKVNGKGLSANDLTDDLKQNYDEAYSHSQSAHAPSEAQANVLEIVKVNGVDQTIDAKSVDITVPTKTSDLTNDSDFQTGSSLSVAIAAALTNYTNTTDMMAAIMSAIASAGHLKREVVAALPDVGAADDDTIYMILKVSGKTKNIYDEYMLINGDFEKIGDTEVDLTGYLQESDIEEVTAEEIIALFN